MKQLIIFSSLAFLPHLLFSQKKVYPVVGLSQTISLGEAVYLNSKLSGGVRLNMPTGYFDLKGAYQFSAFGNYQGHQLGLDIEYRILSAHKRISPYISINGFSEVGTNYRDKYLNSSFAPRNSAQAYSHSYGHSEPHYVSYSNFYHATPFVGSASAGFDLRLAEGLNLNFSIGFGIRLIQTRYHEWTKGSEVNVEQLHSKEINNQYLYMVDTKIGLNYAIYKRNK